MYQASYYHSDPNIQEYLHELEEDGFSKDYATLYYNSRLFLSKICNHFFQNSFITY